MKPPGFLYGLGCGGASVTTAKGLLPTPIPLTLFERLKHDRSATKCLLSERPVVIEFQKTRSEGDFISFTVDVGEEAVELHLDAALAEWLQGSLGLQGKLGEEKPLQQAMIIEAGILDLLRRMEAITQKSIRVEPYRRIPDAVYELNLVVAVSADRKLPVHLRLGHELAQFFLDQLDPLSPPIAPDLSAIAAELIIEAGFQDLTREELQSLRPADVIILGFSRPSVHLNQVLIAPVRRQSTGFELEGGFSPRPRRAGDFRRPTRDDASDNYTTRVGFEHGRVTVTLAEIDALTLGQHLPLGQLDEIGVDIVVDERRIGRGELTVIGASFGVRITNLVPSKSFDTSGTAR